MASAQSQHTSAYLTNVSVKYGLEIPNLIASRAVPIIPVKNENDKYLIFDSAFWARNRAEIIPERGAAPRKFYGTTDGDYSCYEYGLATDIGWREKANADSVFQLEMRRTEYVTEATLLYREKLAADLLFNETTYASYMTQVAAGTGWSGDSANPIQNIQQIIDSAVDQMNGRYPNTIIFGKTPWRYFTQNEEVVKFIYGLGSDRMLNITEQKVAEFFKVQQVLVGMQSYDTSADGGTSSVSSLWGDYVWVGWINPRPALGTASAAYMFRANFMTRKWEESSTGNTVIENRELAVPKVISAPAGHLLYDVAAGA